VKFVVNKQTNIKLGEIMRDGVWRQNTGLVVLLGLCPLLAVTGTVVNALGLGLATLLTLMASNLAVSLIRNKVSDVIRLPAFVMIIATFTTCTELLMQAYTYELYIILGIFIPLIVTNCTILGRAEAFASKNAPLPSVFDGLMMSLGFGAVLLVLGAIREVVGSGTLFANMHLLLGPMAANWEIQVLPWDSGLLIAVLPPGAFLITGLLIALKNMIDKQIKERRMASQPLVAGSKRVRTTGEIH